MENVEGNRLYVVNLAPLGKLGTVSKRMEVKIPGDPSSVASDLI